MKSRIILLNGTSSAGKSTLARALRPALPSSFCYYASDQLADAAFRPLDPKARVAGREAFFRGFHASIPAFASAVHDLLIEHIVETQEWANELAVLLQPFDVFWVGVHAPVEEVERREILRGDRKPGEGVYHLKTHTFCHYDLEVDTTAPIEDNVRLITERWQARVVAKMVPGILDGA